MVIRYALNSDHEMGALMKWNKLFIILFFGLFLNGCQTSSLTTDMLPWTGDEKVLFKDSFTHQSGGWQTYEDSLSLAKYDSGGFRLWADVPHYQFWSVPGLNFKDTLIYTRARKLGGPDDNLFGVLCRYQDAGNYYAFVIGSDGYYGIYKMVSGEQVLIDQVNMDFSTEIHRGAQENDLMVLCKGDQLALFVNDSQLIRVQDETFTFGDVGLIIGNLSLPGVDILFDDFIVVKP